MPYFLFPLQLDSDSQVRRYSPFSGMKEAIAHVLTSFAHSAPKSMHLLIRNHPLDNGLINYRRYIRRFSHACGLEGRVHFVESGRAALMMDRSEGMVVLNSTIGISGLQRGIPVYCVGTSIYAVRGLASSQEEQDLDDFWSNPQKPCPETLRHFEKVLKCPDPSSTAIFIRRKGCAWRFRGSWNALPEMPLCYPCSFLSSGKRGCGRIARRSLRRAQGCGRELLAAGGYRMSALQQVLVSFASATEVKKLAIQHK